MKLQGKVAIVTGASRGIGEAIALAFAKEGADIVIAARSTSETNLPGTIYEVAGKVQALGRKALAVKTDIGDENSIKDMVRQTLDKFGSVDILVNNAAVAPEYNTKLVDYPTESWDLVMKINLRGPFLCAKTVLPTMIKQKSGNIINISSLAGTRASALRIAYGVSKAGLERMTFGLAAEVAQYNIAVNALCPLGFTDTAVAREAEPDADKSEWFLPEHVAEAAVFLATQDSKTLTGKAVTIAPRDRSILITYNRGNADRIWYQI